MDPIANQKEQIELANDLMRIHDECRNDVFPPDQIKAFVHDAMRLAELVLALNEWCKKAVEPLK